MTVDVNRDALQKVRESLLVFGNEVEDFSVKIRNKVDVILFVGASKRFESTSKNKTLTNVSSVERCITMVIRFCQFCFCFFVHYAIFT